FVRHKILDAIGDMSLLGIPLLGAYVSYAGSHKLNHLLTKKLFENSNAFEILESEESQKIYEYALQNA
ncbi:UDP-3-O-acyl-N-acetylglucosamine deacetylase, partial [Helicobacter ganmani]